MNRIARNIGRIDPVTLTVAVVALTLVAAIASFLPAHRAARLDPMAALLKRLMVPLS